MDLLAGVDLLGGLGGIKPPYLPKIHGYPPALSLFFELKMKKMIKKEEDTGYELFLTWLLGSPLSIRFSVCASTVEILYGSVEYWEINLRLKVRIRSCSSFFFF